MPLPDPETLDPTLGLVLAFKLTPNWAEPAEDAVWVARAAIVGVPEQVLHVNVAPFMVID